MTQQAIDIPALADDILNLDGLFDLGDTHVALALYRLLAEGKPVSEERLAARSGRPLNEVADWLRSGSRVELDERGEVVAFQGLSLRPTKHVFEVDGHALYAWCAGDTLAIQDLVHGTVRVRSTDPITGTKVSLSLEDGRVREVEPSTAVFSMPWPHGAFGDVVGDDLIPAACGPINFFDSEKSGREFTDRVPGTFLLAIEEGLELFGLVYRTLFGSAFAGDAR